MKREIAALALGAVIGMGLGPTLAAAYGNNPSQDTVRARRHRAHLEVAGD